MFFVLTKRVVKVATGSNSDQYAARSTNRIFWTMNGPFNKKSLAERAAIDVLGTHTCLEAQVLSDVNVRKLLSSSDTLYELRKVILETVRVFLSTEN